MPNRRSFLSGALAAVASLVSHDAVARFIRGTGVSGLVAPVFAIISPASQADPTLQIDAPFQTGDIVTVQSQAAGGSWSSPVSTTHTITAAELQAAAFDLGVGAMANGSYDFRTSYARGASVSALAYVNNFTISA